MASYLPETVAHMQQDGIAAVAAVEEASDPVPCRHKDFEPCNWRGSWWEELISQATLTQAFEPKPRQKQHETLLGSKPSN